jgi:hypothetical protein
MSSLGIEKFPVIKPGTEAFNIWRQYFEQHLRWTPIVMRKLIDGTPDKPKDGMTVPTEFPQFFDGSFVENKAWQPPPPKQLSKLTHQTMEELQARYGPSWGIKVIQQEGYKRKTYKPFTDDELKSLYRKRDAAE